MIVPTMTPVEIYNEINKDVPKLLRFEARTIHEFGRPAMKSSKYPFARDYVYTSRETGLEYHYRYICWAHKDWKEPWYYAYLRYTHDGGTTVIRLRTYDRDQPLHINIYTPHFFQRYNERVFKDPSATQDSIISAFLQKNISDLEEDESDISVLRHSEMYYQDEAVNYYASIVIEGVVVCESRADEPNIDVCNTFLSLEMLEKDQRINSMHSVWALRNGLYARLNPTLSRAYKEEFMSIMERCDVEGWSQEKLFQFVEDWYKQKGISSIEKP